MRKHRIAAAIAAPVMLVTMSACTASEVQTNAQRFGVTISDQEAASIASLINSVELRHEFDHHRHHHGWPGSTTTTSPGSTTTTTTMPSA